MKKSMRQVYSFAKDFRFLFALLFFCVISTTFIGAAYPFLFGQLVDVILYGQDRSEFLYIVLLYAGLFFVGQALHLTLNMSWAHLMTKFLFSVRKALYNKTLILTADTLEDIQSGDVIKRMRDDAEEFMNLIHWNIFYFGAGLLNLLLSFGLIFYYSFVIGILALAIAPLVAFFTRKYGEYAKQIYRELRRSEGAFQSWIFEILKGMSQIILLGAGFRIIAQFAHKNTSIQRQDITAKKIELTAERVTSGITLAAELSIFAVSAYLVSQGRFTVGAFVSTLAYFMVVSKTLTSLSAKGVAIQNNMAGISRVTELLEMEGESANLETSFTIVNGEIGFDNVCFAYKGSNIVLDHLNLTVRSGECLAVVGKSGVGKSTLVSLLLAFYQPTKGMISIDGQNLSQVCKQQLRAQIGVVWQNPVVFSGTIRDNLRVAKPGASNAELRYALEQAYLWDFVEALPDGIDTVVGDNGRGISGGQKQRIAIARAILKNPRILIFDEATSALDTESELAIQKAWAGLARNRTLIIIAHRLSTIIAADRVALLDQGALVACAHHTELHGKCTAYDELYGEQYKTSYGTVNP